MPAKSEIPVIQNRPQIHKQYQDVKAIVHDWVTLADKSYENNFDELTKSFNTQKGTLKDLELELKLEIEETSQIKEGCNELKDVVIELENQLHTYKEKVENIKEKLKNREAELPALQKEYETKLTDLNTVDPSTKESQEIHNKAINTFAERLGLKFEKIEGEILRLSFTLIDKNDPKKLFTLDIKINGETYEVPSCSPSLPNIDEMITELNKSNDFSAFVLSIRKCFQASLQETNTLSGLEALKI